MSDSKSVLVHLNVGGTSYTTTLNTLLKEHCSIFQHHLISTTPQSTDSALLPMPDGSYFIDRNGSLFCYILEYLRNGELILPKNFNDFDSLLAEAKFYRLSKLEKQIIAAERQANAASGHQQQNRAKDTFTTTKRQTNKPGFLTIGYRSTFAFGRDGQTDVKFRKLYRILVCGKASLCREVFGETLNESRDPTDRDGYERYTSRLYLKHQCLERACDTLAENGFRLIATCCNGANGLTTSILSTIQSSASTPVELYFYLLDKYTFSNILTEYPVQELMNQRNSGDYEEQRWAHYTELIFYRGSNSASATATTDSVAPVVASF
uniref:BTB_2 domain-containing protein n=1 Tax=Syphacia muris TaxID=451379 RepID=A0A158R4F6_9BILA